MFLKIFGELKCLPLNIGQSRLMRSKMNIHQNAIEGTKWCWGVPKIRIWRLFFLLFSPNGSQRCRASSSLWHYLSRPLASDAFCSAGDLIIKGLVQTSPVSSWAPSSLLCQHGVLYMCTPVRIACELMFKDSLTYYSAILCLRRWLKCSN